MFVTSTAEVLLPSSTEFIGMRLNVPLSCAELLLAQAIILR
jgi:hypothetical protein